MSQVFIGYDTYAIDGVDEDFIRFVFDMALMTTGSPIELEVGLVITTDEHIKSLNHRYRGKDKSTNVLSFANGQDLINEKEINEDKNYLGDIYISYPTLMREAKQLKVTSKERFVLLFAHGILHLLGFDHEDSVDASAMEMMEDKIVTAVL